MRWPIRGNLIMQKFLLGMSFPLILIYGYLSLETWKSTHDKTAECEVIINVVTGGRTVRQPRFAPGDAIFGLMMPERALSRPGSAPIQPAILCRISGSDFSFVRASHEIEVEIYDITDKTKQNAILETLQAVPVQSRGSKIVVSFYERKNRNGASDPTSAPEAWEPEDVFRKAIVR